MGGRWKKSEIENNGPDRCGSVGSASPCKVKGRWFDSQLGSVPGWRIQSPDGACERQPINVSLPLFPPSLSLSLQINKILKNKTKQNNGPEHKRICPSNSLNKFGRVPPVSGWLFQKQGTGISHEHQEDPTKGECDGLRVTRRRGKTDLLPAH